MLVVVLMVLLIGASYAAWRYTFTGNANTINTPSIELELLESTDEIINISNALPMSDTQGIEQEQTFNFAVTTETSATIDVGYSLKIEKISVDSGYTALNDNQIKVYLTDYNNTELLGPTLINDLNNYVLYSKTNSHNSTTTKIQDKYKLRTWIDWEVDASNWNQNTKLQYKFKIGVTEKEKVVVYSYSHDNVSKEYSTLESISGYTTDYTELNKTYFLKHIIAADGIVESNEVCYILNSNLYCLKEGSIDHFEENKATLFASFGKDNCSSFDDFDSGNTCSASGIEVVVHSSGFSINVGVSGNICIVNQWDSRCDSDE